MCIVRVLCFVLAALIAGDALAAADTCTFTADGTWSATGTHPTTSGCDNSGVIESGDRVVIPAGIDITTPAGSTISVSEVQSTGSGTWSIASSSAAAATSITLSGCNTGGVLLDTAVKCGALTGSQWTIQGAVLHQSLALNATSPTTSLTTDGNTIRIHPAESPSPAPAAGDWVIVTSGPDKHAWYRVESVSFSACPTAGINCRMDLSLYESTATTDEMAYGSSITGYGAGPTVSTVNRRKDTVSGLGATSLALPSAETGYFANPANSLYDSLAVSGVPTPGDRCIEVCSFESTGVDYACDNATVVAADGDYMGWIAYFNTSSPTATSIQAEVVATYNNISCTGAAGSQASDCIGNGSATVDRICFDRSLAQITTGAGTTARQKRNFLLWPRFGPRDSFMVIRPVNITATNTEWDNSLAFYGKVDADYAYFKNFAGIMVDGSDYTAAPQDPMSYVAIRTKCIGAAVGTTPATQNECANGRVLFLDDFTNLVSRNLALIDPSTPINVGPTGTNSYCADADSNGTCDGGAIADGAANVLADDGTHGLDPRDSNLTLTGLYTRHLLDDALTSAPATDTTVTLLEPYAWMSDSGLSTQCWEPAPQSGATARLTVRDARAIRCAATTGSGLDQVVQVAGAGSASVIVDGLYAMSADNPVAVANAATTKLTSTARNVVVWSQNNTNDGYVSNGVDKLTQAWSWNVGGLFSGASGQNNTVTQTYSFLGTDTGTSPVAQYGNAKFNDNIVANKPTATLMNDALPDYLEVARNVIETSSATTTPGLAGTFTNGDADLFGLGVSNNLFIRSPILVCGDATWGARNQGFIGRNAIMAAGTGTAISNASTNCTLSYAQRLLSTGTFALNRISWQQTGLYGPTARVGVPPSATLYQVLSYDAAYYVGPSSGGCSSLRPCGLWAADGR